MENGLSRRSFLQILSGALIALPAVISGRSLWAVDLKKLPPGAKPLDEKSPMASALGYKHDASQVDVRRYKRFVPGQNCLNCVQYVKKSEGWGECKIIKGGLVATGGWCNSYLALPK